MILITMKILRLGGKVGQSSKEIYRLDPTGNQIKLIIEITTPGDGNSSLFI